MKLAALLAALFFAVPASARPDKPNIILILADDLGYGDLGSYGQKKIKTPHLDRLATEGIRFTQAYSGSTVCAPARSVLMTGRHAGRTRVRGNAGGIAQALRAEDTTIASILQHSGYRTALIGKWGLGDTGEAESGLPRKQGFDSFFGYLNQRHAHNTYPSWLWRDEQKVRLKNTVPNETPVGSGVSDNRAEFAPDLFAAEALSFIREQKDAPFFLYFATTIPHANNAGGSNGIEVPELGEYENRDWPPVEKAFAALVSRLDRHVGDILDLLNELGIDDRTLILFSSDNGPHREGGRRPAFFDSNGPLRGIKRDLTDGGIRVPAIARWPGTIPAGKTSDAIWYFPDVLPTFASLAGAEIPDNIDGVDLTPTLTGKPQPSLSDRFLYWEFHEGGTKQASRQGPWKAIRKSPGAKLELYRLDRDIAEKTDLADRHPDIVRRFDEFLSTARTESPEWPIREAR